MTASLSESQRAALRDLCDTVVPSIEHDPDPAGLWRRAAGDLGVERAVEEVVVSIPDEQIRTGLGQLLDAAAAAGLGQAGSQQAREAILAAVAASSPEAWAGIDAMVRMTLFIHYGAPDPQTGRNPNWDAFGYPGPPGAPPDVAKPLAPLELSGEHVELSAEVCVVGSGSGGSVIAATLAAAGLDVLVLEAAGYFNESDFAGYEIPAYRDMYWRGGPTPTADGNVTIQAGTTLGGGTTINWMNCLRTRPWVRDEWARDHGLEGVDGPEFDAHLDAVMGRLGATDACSDLNGPQQRLLQGCEGLGWSFETIVRNADPVRYDPESAGFIGFGDRSGSKQSADRTWLADAAAAGARLAVRCRAQRVITADGRASGVEAVRLDETGAPAGAVTVTAPRVVVACGALESPALLARSGIGGGAVGDHLHVHPCTAVFAAYDEDQRAWWGPPQAGLCDEFADTSDGYGFLIETTQYAPAIVGSAVPWTSAAEHKQVMASVPNGASFISLTRDRGSGRVTTDAAGEAVVTYSVEDDLDIANLRRGLDAEVRIHEAAGAGEIHPLAAGLPGWKRGDDLDSFIEEIQQLPFGAAGYRMFSAHQMGTCRMGSDPETSVANPFGELHDVRGVWIGDGSAFPTSSGTNPMVSIMALARRTGEAIATAS
jgi:choline dehydrogenase-like flavoprotein